MRFNDGFWLLKSGVKPAYAFQVVKAIPDEQTGFDLHVACAPIRTRGDTLKGPVLNVRVHSPTEGVIGVKIEHFAHSVSKKLPDIPLFPDDQPILNSSVSSSPLSSADASDRTWSVSSGGLTAVVTENPYTVTFNSPKRKLTFAGYKHQAIMDVPSKWTLGSASNTSCLTTDHGSNPHPSPLPDVIRYLHSELNISPGELFYGGGEQFGAFVKNGQTVSIWNQDGGTSSEQAYKCVPFYISNRGYGIFINNPGEVEIEFGSEKVSRVGVSVASKSLEYFVIYGETPLEILDRYTRMTGRPAQLPAWTFGLWLSTSFTTSYSTETVSGFLQGMKERNCPVRVFHLDCFWMSQYEWCSFTFDPENFPDPKAYLDGIKKTYGVKICLWINPYISQLSPIFKEGADGGYFIKRTDGTPWQWDLWQPGLAVVDVTNPDARKWYTDKLSALLDMGVDCFKTDFGERIPHLDVKYHDGSDPMRMHNSFSVIYNELVFTLLEKRFGKGEAVVFARSAAAGGQRFPVHWGGDCESTWEAMAETLRGGLSLTLSGFAFASHDIGGFEGTPPPEVYQRWVAFGMFSSHSRLHGSNSYRVPWNYGEDAAKSMSKFVDAKHRLMPYIYNLAIQAHIVGHPIQRAMFLEFISDRTTHTLDRQYMFGPSILVAPVTGPIEEETEFYLPAGRWTYFFDQTRIVTGPTWVKETVPLDEMPVWIRAGSVIPFGPAAIGRPDYDYNKDLELGIYELAEGQIVETDIPSGKENALAGKIHVAKKDGAIKVTVAGSVDLQTISLAGIPSAAVKSISGGKKPAELDGKQTLLVTVDKGVKEIIVQL